MRFCSVLRIDLLCNLESDIKKGIVSITHGEIIGQLDYIYPARKDTLTLLS